MRRLGYFSQERSRCNREKFAFLRVFDEKSLVESISQLLTVIVYLIHPKKQELTLIGGRERSHKSNG